MEHGKDLTCVFAGGKVKCNVIEEILQKNNIPVIRHDPYKSGIIDGVPGDIELMIEKEDEEMARAHIAEYEKTIH
jgi:hypothetical protein